MKWPHWRPMDLDWLNKLNVVSYLKFYAVWICVGTFMVWAVCTLFALEIDKVAFAEWLTFVAALLGINLALTSVIRRSDYGALDRQAEIERAKTGMPATTTTQEQPTK